MGFLVLGYVILAVMPWYCLPLAWGLVGLAFTGVRSVGHDCSRGSFSRYSWMNTVVGAIVSAPLLLPFESWKVQQKDGKSRDVMEAKKRSMSGAGWLLSSAIETINAHWSWKQWQPGHRRGIIFSMAAVYTFMGIFFPALLFQLGVWGLVKFWLLPFLAYHFWMSTFFSWVYRVPFTKDVSIKFSISFPTKLPRWVNVLTNDINYMLTLSGPLVQSGAESLERFRSIPKHNLKQAFDHVTKALIDSNDPEVPTTVFDKLRKAAAGVNWIPALWILSTPVIGLYGACTTPLQSNTFILAVLGYITAGMGITVGYHRLFAHRAFSCHWPTRLLILLCGTSAFQGSCIWWARDHRAHHRYVDTDKDPYNSRRGFFWAHMGWLLVKQDKKAIGKADCADLEADPLLAWQEKYFLPLSTTLAIVLPVCIAGFGWGDWRGGFFYAAVLRSVMVMQSTFCVNSLAHYFGDLTFSDAHTPRDAFWVSLVTFGEGYHNFHHHIPWDYRGTSFWYAFDPSKWTIWLLEKFGLTFNLKLFPKNEIEKCRLQMRHKDISNKLSKSTSSADTSKYQAKLKKVDAELAKLNWGAPVDSLPIFTEDEVKRRVLEGASLLIIDGLVHDVCEFLPEHPGGEALLKSYLGKDATTAFHGGVYGHGSAATNLLGTLRVGRVVTEEERARLEGETAPFKPVITPKLVEEN